MLNGMNKLLKMVLEGPIRAATQRQPKMRWPMEAIHEGPPLAAPPSK